MKGFIKITTVDNKKLLLNVNEIKLVEDNKVFFFNVFVVVKETNVRIIKLIEQAKN